MDEIIRYHARLAIPAIALMVSMLGDCETMHDFPPPHSPGRRKRRKPTKAVKAAKAYTAQRKARKIHRAHKR
jgi:hypothetical protein